MNGSRFMVRRKLNIATKSRIDAIPAVDFFNHLNMLYGTVTEFCTQQEVRVSQLSLLIERLTMLS